MASRSSSRNKNSRRLWRLRIPAATVFVGFVLTAALGAFAVSEKKAHPLLEVCIGLLTLLLIALYELRRDLAQRVEADDHRSALLAATDSVPWLLEDLRDIATSAKSTLVGSSNRELFEELMHAKIDETKVYVHDLNRGHIRVRAGDKTPMSNQIDLVKVTLQATLIPSVDNKWWLSVDGKDYLSRNRDAIKKRNVKTERIVIWHPKDEHKDDDYAYEDLARDLGQVIGEQQKAGVKLSFAKRSDIKDETLHMNIAIYDETTYNEVAFNPKPTEVWVDYYFDPSDAKQASARFTRLTRYAIDEIPAEFAEHVPKRSDGIASLWRRVRHALADEGDVAVDPVAAPVPVNAPANP